MKRFWWEINALIYDHLMSEVHGSLYRNVIGSLGNLDGTRIDDLGCGNGQLIGLFPKTAVVRGIDISNMALKRAKKRCVNQDVRFYRMDFMKNFLMVII